MTLIGAEQASFATINTYGVRRVSLPRKQGNFKLYRVLAGKSVKEFWYVSTWFWNFDHKDDPADVRVLMQACTDQGVGCKFVIATNDSLASSRDELFTMFKKDEAQTTVGEALSV